MKREKPTIPKSYSKHKYPLSTIEYPKFDWRSLKSTIPPQRETGYKSNTLAEWVNLDPIKPLNAYKTSLNLPVAVDINKGSPKAARAQIGIIHGKNTKTEESLF